ncbi:MAG: BatD family protein, partial [Bdellovibrionales bacterium]
MVTGTQRHKLFAIAFIALFSLFITAQAFAASLTASVDRATVGAGESFQLELSLSGASPKGGPDFTPLEKDFTIVSKGQSSQTTIINNRVSSSINWQLVLIAPIAGDYRIPPLSVDTDEGRLKSDPLKISVQKSSAPAPQARASGTTGTAPKALSVQTDISTRTPYQNEPVLYTVKLVAARSVGDVGIPKFTVPDAVVEKLGDAKVYDARAGGAPVKVIEARYLITPLKSGKIKIPPYIFQGQVVSDVQRGRRSLFNDPFFDMPDPFGMFEGFGNFATTEPFAIAGDEVTLDVKAPAAAMDPWLPLYDLQISENLSGAEDARVGEPLTLSLTMVAKGASGKVLPGLNGQIKENGDFKIYADKPETSEDISKDGKTISGWRQESYTLIPQKSGSLILPEIKVPWWNLEKGKTAYASVPERTITVAPGKLSQTTSVPTAVKQSPSVVPDQAEESTVSTSPTRTASEKLSVVLDSEQGLSSPLHILIAGLGLMVAVLLGAVIFLWRKLKHRERPGEELPHKSVRAANEDKVSLSVVKKAENAEGLKKAVQTYAHQHLGTSKNASLMNIYQTLARNNPQATSTENKQVFLD